MKQGNQNNVVITGFMATGKSTVGRLVAQKLDFKFIDTDALIEKRCGKRVADIFSEEGEEAFRKREEKIAAQLAERYGLVIATGGGMMLNPVNVEVFRRQGHIYCLSASLDQVLERITRDSDGIRPLIQGDDPEKRIQALMLARQSVYSQFIQLDTNGKSPEQVAAEVLAIHARK